jgi:hypothetical protein
MRISSIALLFIMLSFISPDIEDEVMDHCCLCCYMCEYFSRTDIEFYSLDTE